MNVLSVVSLSDIKGYTSIKQKLENKNYTIQFLSHSLEKLSKDKFFFYENKKLKTSYLIDITHNLILKYYFKKENKFHLLSTILKEKYGHLYNYYIKFLVDNGILVLLSKHQKGKNSRIYAICETILRGKITRYNNYDKILLKKYKNKICQVEENSDKNSYIDIDIKSKLINDLFHVNIQFDKSVFYLDNVKEKDIDIYNRNKYSVECINDKHIFYHFDNYGRLHTNFTILKSFIRKNCLLIDNEETYELDLKNSQVLFLSKLIADSGSKWINIDEFKLFSYLTKEGKYYEYLMNQININRDYAKELTYKVLFGRNANNSKSDKIFNSLFPTIYNYIKLYKKENDDYRILAHELQKAESNLIFNKVIRHIMILYPEIKLITIHDSIAFPKKYKSIIEPIFIQKIEEEFSALKAI